MKLSGSVLVPAILAVLSSAPARGSAPKAIEPADVSRSLAVGSATVLSAKEASRVYPVIRAPAIVVAGGDGTVAVPFVVRYQNALGAARIVHLGRLPDFDRKGAVRLNRFIFRKAPATRAPVAAAKR